MEKKNLKGQVLSEKEMKEVKGGYNFTINGDAKALICPVCCSSGNHLTETSKETDYNGNILKRTYLCDVCGSVID